MMMNASSGRATPPVRFLDPGQIKFRPAHVGTLSSCLSLSM